MGAVFKYYKRKFRNALEPVFVMLIGKKDQLDEKEWNDIVGNVALRILHNPTEFLGNDLPSTQTICDVIYEIMEQFVKERGYGKNTFEPIARQILLFRTQLQEKALTEG